MFQVIRLTNPTFEPVTLSELKNNIRLDCSYTAEDEVLNTYISAARDQAEQFICRAIPESNYRLVLGAFVGTDLFINHPCSSILKVEYLNAVNEIVEILDSEYTFISEVNRIYFDDTIIAKAVFINIVDGWQELDVPESLKHAVTMLASDLYTGRTSLELQNKAAMMLMMPFKHRPIL